MVVSALVPVANGTEEIEAITIINVLRRANIDVTISSVDDSNQIEGSRGIKIIADENIRESCKKHFDAIILPGGLPGAEHLRDSPKLIEMLHEQNKNNRLYAAICASPAIVLEPHHLLEGKIACCFPCFKLKKEHQPEDLKSPIVLSKNLLTAQGPGIAMAFSLKLVELLKDPVEAKKIAKGMLVEDGVIKQCRDSLQLWGFKSSSSTLIVHQTMVHVKIFSGRCHMVQCICDLLSAFEKNYLPRLSYFGPMSKKKDTHESKRTALKKVKPQHQKEKKEKDFKKKKQLRPNSHASILKEVQSLQLRIEQECQESSSTFPSLSQAEERNENEATGATCFEELPLSNRTLRALKLSNFKHLTPIQRECIPLGLLGFDILGEAETGSGKTLAFLIPVLENLYRDIWEKHDGLGSLIITPTRELAAQIFDVLQSVGKFHTFSAICLIGGKNIQHEQGRVQDMNIVIATPGRLLHHLEESPLFDPGQLKMLVIDEADMLLDMGFSDSISQILQHLPDSSTRQTFLFSATLSVAVHRLALLSLKDTAKKVTVRPSGIVPPKERLKQYYIVLELDQQLNVFFSILKHRAQKKIIVFVNSCKQVRYIYEVFWRLKPGCALFELHGRQNQQKRLDMLGKFSLKPTAACLICTDIGARGIDFPSVDVVIQLNCPPDIATYVHRIGRTARYNECGMSILCLLNSERLFLERLKEQKIHPQQMFLRPEKLLSLNKKLSSILAENPSLKYLAQRYVVSYLRSVHLCRDKGVFSYSQCIGGSDGLQKFAYSLGLVSLPPDVLDIVSIPEKKKKLTKLERFKLKIEEKKKSSTAESCPKIMSKKEKQFQRLRQLRESGTSLSPDDQTAGPTAPEEDSILIAVKSPKPSTAPAPVLSHGTIAKKLKVDNIRIKADGTTKIKGLAMLTSKRPEDKTHHVLFDEQEDGTIQPQTIFESLVKELNENVMEDAHDENPETYVATLRQTLSHNEAADKPYKPTKIVLIDLSPLLSTWLFSKIYKPMSGVLFNLFIVYFDSTDLAKKCYVNNHRDPYYFSKEIVKGSTNFMRRNGKKNLKVGAHHDLESTASSFSSSEHPHDNDSPHDLTQLEEDALNVLHPLLCTT